jgi:hypothetical protein
MIGYKKGNCLLIRDNKDNKVYVYKQDMPIYPSKENKEPYNIIDNIFFEELADGIIAIDKLKNDYFWDMVIKFQ